MIYDALEMNYRSVKVRRTPECVHLRQEPDGHPAARHARDRAGQSLTVRHSRKRCVAFADGVAACQAKRVVEVGPDGVLTVSGPAERRGRVFVATAREGPGRGPGTRSRHSADSTPTASWIDLDTIPFA
ncbi:hypothetical protein GCM10018952_48220 [Streptosporangium vulgare]